MDLDALEVSLPEGPTQRYHRITFHVNSSYRSVERRFADFEVLDQTLARVCPSLLRPALPRKEVVGMHRLAWSLSYALALGATPAFFEERRAGLLKYLRLICEVLLRRDPMPELRPGCPVLAQFLNLSPEEIMLLTEKRALPGQWQESAVGAESWPQLWLSSFSCFFGGANFVPAESTDDSDKPLHWSLQETPSQGWLLQEVFGNGVRVCDYDRDVETCLKAMLSLAVPKELGKGRDMRCYKRPYSRLVLEHAWRIETLPRWKKYIADREEVGNQMKRIQRLCPPGAGPVVTDLDAALGKLPGGLMGDLNEKFLLHGTKPEHVLTILANGFNEKYCSMDGLFGAGVYMADRPEKTDQYTVPHACDDSDVKLKDLSSRLYLRKAQARHTGEVFYAFVCRTTLGFPNVTMNATTSELPPYRPIFADAEKRRLADVPNLQPPLPFHSLLGCGMQNAPLRFREYIVFEGLRIYPEYLIAYTRQ